MKTNSIKLLDCTLRDGVRIVNCQISDKDIQNIIDNLSASHIDIIEVGFIRDSKNFEYHNNTTFFTSVNQITPFLKRRKGCQYVAFIDYDLYDFSLLEPRTKDTIDGIRVGFKRNDYENNLDSVYNSLLHVKELGYDLYVQGVNSLGYSDGEILSIVDIVNKINPVGFGIVDTYGAMYSDDVKRLFTIVDHNLNDNIAIDFHSHNNYQLSFSLAQEILSLRQGQRNVIIDATLNGIGKGAGNLNLELIVDFLNRKYGCDYNFDLLLDTIDEHIHQIKMEHSWGYSIPSLLAGVFKSHPNNIKYLTEKFRLDTKDIKYILSMLDEKKRQSYDYYLIEQLYIKYNSNKKDDQSELSYLSNKFKDKEILIVAPGNSIIEKSSILMKKIQDDHPIVISVNFPYEKADYVFWGSEKRYKQFKKERENITNIVTSNVYSDSKDDIVLSYIKLIECGWKYFDNSIIMLLRLLKNINVSFVSIAGFDGYSTHADNYFDSLLVNKRNVKDFDTLNHELHKMFFNILASWKNVKVSFITNSQFERDV